MTDRTDDNPPPASDGNPSIDVTAALAAAATLTEVDPDALTAGERGDLLLGLLEVRDRLEATACRVAAVASARLDHAADGARSLAAWLTARTELSRTTAAALVRRGETLTACPVLEAAHRAGTIGTAKTHLLLKTRDGLEDRFATDETLLVDTLAPLTVRQAGIVARRWRELALSQQPHSPDDPRPDPEENNTLTLSPGLDGTRILTGTLDPVTGTELQRLIDAEIDRRFQTGDYRSDDGLGAGRRRAEALLALARRGNQRHTEHGAARPSVTAIIDYATLMGLPAQAAPGLLGRRCELTNGTPIPLQRLHDLIGQGTLRLALADLEPTGQYHPVGEITTKRTANARQRRMLALRDQTCAFPGCDQPGDWTDAHHTNGWHPTHQTDVPHLVLLCPFHHHQIIHGDNGFTLTTDPTATSPSPAPDGTTLPTTPPATNSPTTEPTSRQRPTRRCRTLIRCRGPSGGGGRSP